MGNALQSLFAAPEINPINHKAKSVPVLNPFDRYGRVFFFSWLGFLVAFLSWYAFPPLVNLSFDWSLAPLCDRFGPRLVFIGVLLCGAIPTAMAGLVTNPGGLIALRFFVGILGASFVPCQVWTTGFFDKNVVGTANALAAGWGNAGGGITYFVMPAVYDSLVQARGLSPHQAWRVAYIVPFVIITAIALGMLSTCDDTPTGRWSERHLWGDETPSSRGTSSVIHGNMSTGSAAPPKNVEKKTDEEPSDVEALDNRPGQVLDQEMVIAPTLTEATHVIFSLATWSIAATYACTFGAELALDSVLGSYYGQNFPYLGQTESGRWAAMFGLLNVVFRPLGGYISDVIYRHTQSVWAKKTWLTFLGIVTGAFLLAIGLDDPTSEATMFGLSAGMAFFLEAANGANFSVVPHVHPFANGRSSSPSSIVSGVVGACGNLGGIIFAIIFRYNGVHYGRSIWIMGVICLGVFAAQSWIRPIPKV
ncbi:Nitrate transporter CrnA [Rasamsonia emersonii CBS 393.64]|uniref:Nitrate/nitrite transporter n=1 Tax=Rasamsonia emersonii (strain ATCC 16479 / CBS 393.64 / IMI 116815) TaxID=1408163 RepID=A0A0F4YIJ4_RASE3|nr:Nitrate transporter CrnA [Rasamsonia emersonii CBS 393.64]KKA17671.1 Nitrate transporter CrnA [Rasamsonia emersonii CBS 393.64]